MDYTYQPPDDPQDHRPTEQFWPMSSAGYGPQGPNGPGHGDQRQESSGIRQHFARDRRKALHWTVGITAAAILAGGGIIGGVALSGRPAPTVSGPTGPAAVLNATLSSADSPNAASPAPSATPATGTPAAGTAGHPCAKAVAAARTARAAGHPRAAGAARAIASHCRGLRLRVARLIGGIDGQFTFRTKTGTRTLAYERGVIQSVTSGSNIVVRASDGTTWTWDLVSNTVVREKGAKTAESTLAQGQQVWVGGQVTSGAKDARLIVIRPAAAPSPAPPSGSGS